MRNLARFIFGFSVEVKPVANAVAVVAAVAEANDLAHRVAAKGAWWRGLVGDETPKIIALLPFIAAQERPADFPAFVISPPLADPTPFDFSAVALIVDGPFKSLEDGATLSVSGNDVLYAVAGELDADVLNRRLEDAGVKVQGLASVGGFRARAYRRRSATVALRKPRAMSQSPTPSGAAFRRPRHPRLRAGQGDRDRWRQGPQAIVQRDAASGRAPPRSRRTRRWRTGWSATPTGRRRFRETHRRCLRAQSGADSLRQRLRRCPHAPSPTPTSATATKRSTSTVSCSTRSRSARRAARR